MKRLFFSLALAATLAIAGSATAQAPANGSNCNNCDSGAGQVPYGPYMQGGYMGGYGHGFGHPGGHMVGKTGFLSGIFSNHPHKDRANKNQDRIRNAAVLPVAQGGTLVFPQNPFVRSPRDFFMWDER